MEKTIDGWLERERERERERNSMREKIVRGSDTRNLWEKKRKKWNRKKNESNSKRYVISIRTRFSSLSKEETKKKKKKYRKKSKRKQKENNNAHMPTHAVKENDLNSNGARVRAEVNKCGMISRHS